MEDREWEQQWKIINNYWTRLSKISWFVCGEQINICRSRRLSQIIDLHDKQLLFYHLITEFVLFNEYPWEAKRSAIFKQEWSQEGEKHGFLYACAEYYLQPNTVGRHCTWADHYLQAVICRSRGGLLTNEKKEKFASNDNKGYYIQQHCFSVRFKIMRKNMYTKTSKMSYYKCLTAHLQVCIQSPH